MLILFVRSDLSLGEQSETLATEGTQESDRIEYQDF